MATVGAIAFGIMAAPIVAFSVAIVNLSREAVKAAGGADSAKAAAEGLAAVLKAGVDITESIIPLLKRLAAMSPLIVVAPFIAGMMTVGAVAFGIIAAPIVAFAVALTELGQELLGIADPRITEQISACLRGIGVDEIGAATTRNFFRLFACAKEVGAT